MYNPYAQQQFNAQQQANLQAQQANQSAGLQTQQMGEQSKQFGAGYGMQNLNARMQGAQQLAGMGQAQLGAQQGIYNLQNTVGAQQQGLEQQKINQAMTDYANAQQYPLMQLGTMSNMLRGLPMQAQTTNQYAAAPNQTTQAIGTAGAAASLYNALKAEGGVIEEKRMASGGITDVVPRYDIGGEVYADLMKMGPEELQAQIKNSSSEKVKEMAKSLLKQKQMAGGGIVAFAEGPPKDRAVEEDGSDYFGSSIKKMDTAEKEFANPAMSKAMTAPVVAPPPPAAEPTGIMGVKPPEPTTGVGTLQATRETIGQDYNKPMAERIAEKQALYKEQGVGAPGAEQREKLMAERANAADEAERTKWMRAAKFFASWGSTPGSTLVAGMAAVRESVPDMINDAKEAKKIRMEMDKTIAGLDEATRLEKKGFVDEAYAEKMKLGEKMQALNIEIAKIQAQQEGEDKKTLRGEQHDVRMIAAQKEVEGMKLAAQKEIKEMEGEWRKLTASGMNADRLQRLYSDTLNRKAIYENQISSVMKSDVYQRAAEAANMDPAKSPAAAKMQKEGALALEGFENNFRTMRETADKAISHMSTKVGLPPDSAKPKGGAAPALPRGAVEDK
jgi:soluble cytochrome b562